ncbi:MAG: hypothetical protein IPJ88_02470 [Myxococcales bacterium]|nr:MAG: hypothetical protein IPJ88_02470 [Myxococcales bacterium]
MRLPRKVSVVSKTFIATGFALASFSGAGCAGTSPASIVHNLHSPATSSVAPLHARQASHTQTLIKRGGFVNGQTEHTYPLVLSEPGFVQLALDNISAGQDYDLFVLAANGRVLYNSRTMDNRDEFIETGFLPAGSYRISILNYRGDTSSRAYKLSVEIVPQRDAVSNVYVSRGVNSAGSSPTDI